MVKQDIVEHLTHNCGLHRSSAITAVNSIVDLLRDTISKGESISLRGLGTFRVKVAKEKEARNISKDEKIVIPARMTIKFVPGAEVKEALKQLPVPNDD